MKTSTMGIIVGSSALASAGAVKVSKGYQRKKLKMARQNEHFSTMQEMKKGIKQGVKAGTDKTTGLIKTGIETEKEMIKGGIDKTVESVKSGIEAQQKMMEKEKEMLDRLNESIQKKDMTMGVVVGSTALLTTGIVLALNAYQKKQDNETGTQVKSAAMQKIGGGLKSGTDKVISGMKNVMDTNKKKTENSSLEHVGETVEKNGDSEVKFIPDSTVREMKDTKESVDAERDPAYKGLTELDTQYRDEWQANGIPQTHEELKKLGAEGQEENGSPKMEALKEKLEKNNAE